MTNLEKKEVLAEMIVSMSLSDKQLTQIADALTETCNYYLQMEDRLKCYERVQGFRELVLSGQKK